MTTLLTRILRDRCTRCQVGQGRMCNCQGFRKVNTKLRIPEPVQIVLIYGSSVALVLGLVRAAWRAWA